jgi:hypothetical protein
MGFIIIGMAAVGFDCSFLAPGVKRRSKPSPFILQIKLSLMTAAAAAFTFAAGAVSGGTSFRGRRGLIGIGDFNPLPMTSSTKSTVALSRNWRHFVYQHLNSKLLADKITGRRGYPVPCRIESPSIPALDEHAVRGQCQAALAQQVFDCLSGISVRVI